MNDTTPLEQAGAQLRQAAQDASLLALTRAYPHWEVRQDDSGRWYATRHTPPPQGEYGPRPARTIEGPDLDELTERITSQENHSSISEASS